MGLYVQNVVRNSDVRTDVRTLVPDAGARRRMSRIVKESVCTAVECIGGVDMISELDAIITATGYGCLADSEKFLRNIINDKEELLNPAPFIQSTFNTVGGVLAMMRHNHCYNMTYVNRGHSFEDALLDAFLRAEDCISHRILVGAFDERVDSQYHIMERMGAWRNGQCGEGAVFMLLSSQQTQDSICQVKTVDFAGTKISDAECMRKYASCRGVRLIRNDISESGKYPSASSVMFASAVDMIKEGEPEVIIYNDIWGGGPAIVVLRCIC